MRLRLLFLTAGLGGLLVLACHEPEPLIVYLPPDASAALSEELAPDEADIPCAPRRVLQTICQQCHARPTKNGAPFPLVYRSDVVVHAYGGVVVRELMIEELEAGRMPLAPVTIEAAEKTTLLDWLRAGAPADPDVRCDDAGTDAETEDAK